MRYLALTLAVVTVSTPAFRQQQPPATEVFLFDMLPANGPRTWINISNNAGYDNQPSFTPDSRAVLFSSDREGKQTDIYRYDIAAKQLTQLTRTPEPEYSPLVTPDGKGVSVIRVEPDKTQRLWRFDLDGSNPRLVLENVKPVGYHAWIDPTHLALFVLGSPNSLQVADTTTGQSETIEGGIGRSILIRPRTGTVTFISTGASPTIKEMDPRTRKVTALRAPLAGSQDMAWMPDGHVLYMASGTTIHGITVEKPDSNWSPFFQFAGDKMSVRALGEIDSPGQEPADITRFDPQGRPHVGPVEVFRAS